MLLAHVRTWFLRCATADVFCDQIRFHHRENQPTYLDLLYAGKGAKTYWVAPDIFFVLNAIISYEVWFTSKKVLCCIRMFLICLKNTHFLESDNMHFYTHICWNKNVHLNLSLIFGNLCDQNDSFIKVLMPMHRTINIRYQYKIAMLFDKSFTSHKIFVDCKCACILYQAAFIYTH